MHMEVEEGWWFGVTEVMFRAVPSLQAVPKTAYFKFSAARRM